MAPTGSRYDAIATIDIDVSACSRAADGAILSASIGPLEVADAAYVHHRSILSITSCFVSIGFSATQPFNRARSISACRLSASLIVISPDAVRRTSVMAAKASESAAEKSSTTSRWQVFQSSP
jgi:hypothetical protein